MIYFSRALQERVQRILHESLAMGGCLGLGRSESLQFTPLEDRYEAVSREEKWYRKVRP
jgi:chemotaxis protein methyltransferase CheR